MTVRSLFGALALLCSSGSMALAQGETRWSLYGPADRPDIVSMAHICPRLDLEVTGNFFCVSLGCTQGRPPAWRVEFVGAGEVPQEVGVQVAVDNLGQTPFRMQRADRDGVFGYDAPYDAVRDAPLLAALSTGQTGLISFDTPWLSPVSFALAGAPEAMQTALAQCRVPAAGGTGTPRDAILAELAQVCGTTPGQLRVDDGFETRADITGDGLEDLIYSYGTVDCPTGRSPGYCGSGGCTHAIWAAQATGEYREVFRDTIYGLTAGWMPVLSIEVHGSACRRTGASGPCTLTYRVAPDGTLARME